MSKPKKNQITKDNIKEDIKEFPYPESLIKELNKIRDTKRKQAIYRNTVLHLYEKTKNPFFLYHLINIQGIEDKPIYEYLIKEEFYIHFKNISQLAENFDSEGVLLSLGLKSSGKGKNKYINQFKEFRRDVLIYGLVKRLNKTFYPDIKRRDYKLYAEVSNRIKEYGFKSLSDEQVKQIYLKMKKIFSVNSSHNT